MYGYYQIIIFDMYFGFILQIAIESKIVYKDREHMLYVLILK